MQSVGNPAQIERHGLVVNTLLLVLEVPGSNLGLYPDMY
jgi:hypothetical protein